MGGFASRTLEAHGERDGQRTDPGFASLHQKD
jgi:hypothetical protein